MERTLEQVIMDIAAHNWSSFVDKEEEAAAIAEAVRGWMKDNVIVAGAGGELETARIKELEAEVARLTPLIAPGVTHTASAKEGVVIGKAAKYDELRAKFPFLPGEVFYVMAANNGKLYKDTVSRLCVDGKIDGEKIVNVRPEAAHPTVDACRAAIPVEE